MKNKILALEEGVVTQQPQTQGHIARISTPNELRVMAAQVDGRVSELENQDRVLTETEDIQNTLDQLINNVQARQDLPFSEGEAQLASLAVEHMCLRLGLAKSVAPALESFKTAEGVKDFLIQLKSLQQRVAVKYEAALETFAPEIGFAPSAVSWTAIELNEALARLHQYLSKQPSNTEPSLVHGHWLRSFGNLGRSPITAKQLATRMTQLSGILRSSSFMNHLVDFSSGLSKISSKDLEKLSEKPFDSKIGKALASLEDDLEKLKRQIGEGDAQAEVYCVDAQSFPAVDSASKSLMHELQEAARVVDQIDRSQRDLEKKYKKSVHKPWSGRLIGFLFGFLFGFILGWWWDTYRRDKKVEEKDQEYRRMAEAFRSGSRAIVEFEKLIIDIAEACVNYIEQSE